MFRVIVQYPPSFDWVGLQYAHRHEQTFNDWVRANDYATLVGSYCAASVTIETGGQA